MVGASAAGAGNLAQGGQGIMLGGQSLAQRGFLQHRRQQESAADQAALNYLERTGQSPKGMISLFEQLASNMLASAQYLDPYVLSHPMPMERIRNLERRARESPYYDKPTDPGLVRRHELMQAKLAGFLRSPQRVFQRYPRSDTSQPARYARAITAARSGDLNGALPEINALLQVAPDNPYFWEFKGQALFEAGRPGEAVAPLRKAVELAPDPGANLIRVLLAQALLATETAANVDMALAELQRAQRTEDTMPLLHHQFAIAYGRKGNIGMADLSTAEAALRRGDLDLAKQKARDAQNRLQQGSPGWIRAGDILNVQPRS